MRAARALSQDPADPLCGLSLVDVPEPEERPKWTKVRVRAASVNMHDVWTLRGVGHPADRLPITLGCDMAGTTADGRDVLIHPVFGDSDAGRGDVTLDPGRHLMSERLDGTFAEWVLVPSSSLIDKPEWLSFEEAACLPVAWGTAYRMLFTRAGVRAGDRVLVQGAGGGVAGAAIALSAAAGAVTYATSRSAQKREYATALGAKAAVETGTRLPEKVDVVVETVGEVTWSHSMRALRPGGVIVIAGATTGDMPPADLTRIFYLQQSVLGSTGCTKPELESLLRMMEATGVRPRIDSVHPLADIHTAFARMIDGEVLGKIVVTP